MATPTIPEAPADRFAGLPGWDLVSAGRADLRAGRRTIEAMLVACAPERMAAIGLPLAAPLSAAPEVELYRFVEAAVGEQRAHGQYNALRRRFTSFLTAARRGKPTDRERLTGIVRPHREQNLL